MIRYRSANTAPGPNPLPSPPSEDEIRDTLLAWTEPPVIPAPDRTEPDPAPLEGVPSPDDPLPGGAGASIVWSRSMGVRELPQRLQNWCSVEDACPQLEQVRVSGNLVSPSLGRNGGSEIQVTVIRLLIPATGSSGNPTRSLS